MTGIVEVLPDQQALVERALELVVQTLQAAAEQNGRCTIALAGGSTPKPLYEALASQPLPWQQMLVFWGDERYVAPDHPDSNARMARLAWLNQVPIPPEHIFPMPTTAADPQVAAAEYEQTLRTALDLTPAELPQLDVILLGMGDDAHTASLFPHTAALQVTDRLITVGEKDGQPRLTFTIPLINQGRNVFFLISGKNKQAALKQVFAPAADANTYPARHIQPQGQLWWLLDAEAGAEMTAH